MASLIPDFSGVTINTAGAMKNYLDASNAVATSINKPLDRITALVDSNELARKTKLAEDRQAAQDARQAKMDLLATPGTAEYAAAQKAKWELEQQNPDVVAQNEFRKVRANAMGPVAMNNELIDAVSKYAGSVDISKMTPEEQSAHWKKLETVGNSLQDSVQQPTTAQAYGYMGQSPLMANNTYYQDEMAAKLTAEEMAQATRVTDAYKAKQSLAEKMLDAQAKYANKNGGSITLEDGTTINTGGSGSSKGTSAYDAEKDIEKYKNSLYARIEKLAKDNESNSYTPDKIRSLADKAMEARATPEELLFDKNEGYITMPSVGSYVEKVVTPQGTRAPFNTSAYDEMMAQQNAIIESGGNLKPAAKKYDNRKILAMLNGEEFIDDTSPAAISSYIKDPALSKVFDDAGVDSKKVGSYLTKAYKEEGGQGDDKGKYKGLGQFAEDTAEPYLKALGKTWEDYRKDEGLQRTVMEQFTGDNYKKLVKANIEPTEFNLYLMHNQGEGGANAYLSGKPLDQMQSYRLLNQLSNKEIGVDLPRHKSGSAEGQIDYGEVNRQGIDLTKIDARKLYSNKFEKKFGNTKEDVLSRLNGLKPIENAKVTKQSIADMFSKVEDKTKFNESTTNSRLNSILNDTVQVETSSEEAKVNRDIVDKAYTDFTKMDDLSKLKEYYRAEKYIKNEGYLGAKISGENKYLKDYYDKIGKGIDKLESDYINKSKKTEVTPPPAYYKSIKREPLNSLETVQLTNFNREYPDYGSKKVKYTENAGVTELERFKQQAKLDVQNETFGELVGLGSLAGSALKLPTKAVVNTVTKAETKAIPYIQKALPDFKQGGNTFVNSTARVATSKVDNIGADEVVKQGTKDVSQLIKSQAAAADAKRSLEEVIQKGTNKANYDYFSEMSKQLDKVSTAGNQLERLDATNKAYIMLRATADAVKKGQLPKSELEKLMVKINDTGAINTRNMLEELELYYK